MYVQYAYVVLLTMHMHTVCMYCSIAHTVFSASASVGRCVYNESYT